MSGETREARSARLRRGRLLDAAAALAIIAAGLVAVSAVLLNGRGLDLGYYSTQAPGFRVPVWRALLEAAVLSLAVTAGAYALGNLIGFGVGWVRAVERPVSEVLHENRRARLRALATAAATRMVGRAADFFVELIRGTPLLVQMLFVWSAALVALPSSMGLTAKSLVAGLIAMTLNTGAYQSEIFRAGILAVPRGQLEAARAVGLTRFGAMRSIVLPQTFRLVAAPLTNEFISLFKVSSLLFLIGVAEVTSVSRSLSNFNPRIFEVFLLTTAIYLLLTVPLGRAARLLERRFKIPGLGISVAAV